MKFVSSLIFFLSVFCCAGTNNFSGENDSASYKLFDLKGKEVKFSKFKGKVVYVHFWASWCGPCKQFFTYSTELKQKFSKKQLKKIEFVYVSVDNDIQAWKNALEKTDVRGVQWISSDNLPDCARLYFKITSIPRFVIIDKEGKISTFIAKTPYMFDVYDDLLKLINE